MKRTLIIIASAAALTASAVSLLLKYEHSLRCNAYKSGKEAGIKEHMFITKSYPPPPRVVAETLDRYDRFQTATLQWLGNMLLCNKIELQSIPREIRIASQNLYIYALRLSSRGLTCERFIKDMNTLCEDICSLDNDDKIKKELVGTFSNYLHMTTHKEEEAFVNFERNLCEEILWEMRRCGLASRKTLEDQLRACKA